MMRRADTGFTLVELLIVVALLGALATVVMPGLSVRRVASLEQVVSHDMAQTRSAFRRLYEDALLGTADLENVRRYGLYPLMQRPDGALGGWSLPRFDAERTAGWRGPYVQAEGRRAIDPDATIQGQPAGGVVVPVVQDPFCASATDGQYYRVLTPMNTSGDYVYQQSLLAFVGPNGTLDVSPPTLADGAWLDPADVVAGTDDQAVLLCPQAEGGTP